ncbi:hypothetical protein [Bartonella sp. ML70XJBT.G]|uniref:hypothetical protein n=1 Tax=Bartonella sp. ML70XJBT.G TaxID=3019093 RepID=UPI0023604808|nr:hypothetical protein [Bartonella sp. ML70XJBT.G]
MSDKQPLPTFSSICKSKPIYNYTITEQEIKSLQHHAKIGRCCDVAAVFLVGIMILVVIWMRYDDDDDGYGWGKISVFGMLGGLLTLVVSLSIGALSNSDEIWENVKQVSEVICEKK